MNVVLNQYYLKQLEAITNHVLVSRGGSKQILKPLQGENDYLIITDRTTYPNYIRFFFTKPKKGHLLSKPYLEGYYNGNRKELIRILDNLKLGRVKTERLSFFLGEMFYNYYYYIKDYEEQYNEKYFNWNEEDYKEIPI